MLIIAENNLECVHFRKKGAKLIPCAQHLNNGSLTVLSNISFDSIHIYIYIIYHTRKERSCMCMCV